MLLAGAGMRCYLSLISESIKINYEEQARSLRHMNPGYRVVDTHLFGMFLDILTHSMLLHTRAIPFSSTQECRQLKGGMRYRSPSYKAMKSIAWKTISSDALAISSALAFFAKVAGQSGGFSTSSADKSQPIPRKSVRMLTEIALLGKTAAPFDFCRNNRRCQSSRVWVAHQGAEFSRRDSGALGAKIPEINRRARTGQSAAKDNFTQHYDY
ncbi:hypothetical protein [Thiolapillus sp.]